MPAARLDGDKAILSNLVRRMHNREQDPLTPLIDRYFLLRDKSPTRFRSVTLPLEERPRPGGRLSPSQMGGCQRAAVFKFVGMPGIKRTDPQSEAIFLDGNWRHHKWQALVKDMEAVLGRSIFKVISIEEDVQIEDLVTAGSLDILVWIKGFGRLVIDIKGINDAGFSRITAADSPLEKHQDQLATYCKARGVARGLLLYENKNDQRWRCYLLDVDDELWGRVEKWATRVLWYLDHRKLPPRDVECEGGTFLYDRCPYAKHCFGSKDHEEIRAQAYRGFRGVKQAWRAGMRAAQGSGDSERSVQRGHRSRNVAGQSGD